MKLLKVYFIPGLGTDSRVFARIRLPENCQPVFLDWIEPEACESIESYAKRMTESINDKENFVLLGLSLGGMIACEMNKFIRPQRTILISSAATAKELPLWIKLAGKLKMHRLVPFVINRNRNYFIAKFIGARSKNERKVFATMRKASSRKFSIWAVREIISWQNNKVPENMIRLHGTADLLFACHKDPCTIPIKGGSHFMIYNRAEEINKLLAKILL